MDGLSSASEVDLLKSGGGRGKHDHSKTCNYCLGQGHWKKECPVLKSHSKSYPGNRLAKPVALAVSVRAAEKAGAVAAVTQHTKPMETVTPVVSGLEEADIRSVDQWTQDIVPMSLRVLYPWLEVRNRYLLTF